MTEANVNTNMSSPVNRNATHLSKPAELSGHAQNNICIKYPQSPKKEKGNTYTQMKYTQKSPEYFSGAGHNNSLPDTETPCIHTSSSIVSKEAIQQKEYDSGNSSRGFVESAQSESSGISYTKKSTRREKQYRTESLKEHTNRSPSRGKEDYISQLNCHLLRENKNVEGSNCGVQTKEIYETSESLQLINSTDSSCSNAIDKRKERRKVAKKLAKDGKRKQRELEEYKKNLHYPKGQRIQVIDHNTFHKILKDAGSLHTENKKPVLSSEEFPAINVFKYNNRCPVMPCQNSSVQLDTEKLRVQDKVTNKIGESMTKSENCSVVNGGKVNKTEKKLCIPNKPGTKDSLKKIGKLPKKRDPIQIDILQCIKMVKSKDAVAESRKKLNTLERRNDSSLISGNELDSSNPQRSRGKKRENPKKKRPTRLKLVILHERELRKQLQKLQESELPQAEKAHFGTETSMQILTAGDIELQQVETVTNLLDNEVVETVSGSMNPLTAGSIKLEQMETFINMSDHKVNETVPGSRNLRTAEGIKLEQVDSVTDMSHGGVLKIMPQSTNFLAAERIKLEQVELDTNMSDHKVVETVPGSKKLQTAQGIKLERVDPVIEVSDNGVFKTVPPSTNLLTTQSTKLEQMELITNVADKEVVETVPGSVYFLTARDIKLEKVEPITNVLENEVVETVPGSTNLLTAGGIKIEQVETVTNVLDNEVIETVPGSMNLLTARGIKLENVEPVTNVSNKEVVKILTGAVDVSKEDRFVCEKPSSESKTAVAATNKVLNAEDDNHIHLLRNLHITNNQPCTNERGEFPDFVPSLLCSTSESLKKENQEITSSEKKSRCIVNLKQGHHSGATPDGDIKCSRISSNAEKHKILHRSLAEHCIERLETVSFTDSNTCNKLHQMDCRKFSKDRVCDSSPGDEEAMQKTIIHTRRFKPYCDHFITPEINSSVSALLQDIVKFHDRQFERDPVKANARRRHVTGLREVLKYLNLKRLKIIVIAPDMELIQGKGGICDIVEQLKEGAQNQEIPYVFALRRRELGKITVKKVPVSCVGIINYDGTEKNYHSLVAALQVARARYQEALTNLCFKDTHSDEVDINKQVIEATLSRLTENSAASCSEQRHLCSETDQKWEE